MSVLVKSLKVSSKGQVTLPKQVRDRLQSDIVDIVMDDSGIHIRPARDLSGTLKRYAKAYVPLDEVRQVLAARVKARGYRRP